MKGPAATVRGAELVVQPDGLRERLSSGISRNVVVLGLVSLLTNIASEMIVPVRAIFLVAVLHTPLPFVGLIEGIAETTAALLKIISGRAADRLPSRKPAILLGYGLSSLAKPLLGLVGTWPQALLVIFLDRVGKGFRTAPRDALFTNSTSPGHTGKAFGFRRSMDLLGAALGPLLAVLVLFTTGDDLRAVFLWAAVPGCLSVLGLLFFLRERARQIALPTPLQGVSGDKEPVTAMLGTGVAVPARSLGARFWMFAAVATIFALGNSSDAFLLLRAAELEVSVAAVPLAYFGFKLVYCALAAPLGALSDRWGRLPVLITGYSIFILVYFGWAVSAAAWNLWLLFLLYGVYAAATDGVGRAFVADLVPSQARGTALGWFSALTGLALLPANLISGVLWSEYGYSAVFGYSAWSAALALALLLAWLPWLRRGYAVG